jgi:hypothetical protein
MPSHDGENGISFYIQDRRHPTQTPGQPERSDYAHAVVCGRAAELPPARHRVATEDVSLRPKPKGGLDQLPGRPLGG